MTKYRVNVNGEMFEVEVELMENAPATSAPATSAPATPAPAAACADGEKIEAPMPGTILSVNINTGDKIKKGQVLFVLEAMKMENEIMSPCDATVTSVSVTKGAAVDSGAVLCTLA